MSFVSGTSPDFLPKINAPTDGNDNMLIVDKSYTNTLPNTQTNSALLKQRLEIYWKEMAKYQGQQNTPESNDITSNPSYQDLIKQQSPEVIEQAKKFVKTLLENDNIQNNLGLQASSNIQSSNNEDQKTTSKNDASSRLKKTPELPLDLTIPLAGKKRPASEISSKPTSFRNAHLQSRTIVSQASHTQSTSPVTSDSTTTANREPTLPPGLTQPQVSHLQQWLVSLPNKGMYPMSMLQQPPMNPDDSTAKRQRTEAAFSPPNFNNPLAQYGVNHIFTMPKIPQANYRPGQEFSPQMQMRNVPPNNQKSPVPTISPSANQSSPTNSNGKRYKRYAKPPYSYVSLISLSILSSPEKKLRLSQILKRISEMFPFFNGSYQGWRDSVRHNLSQNECFVKVLKNPFRPTAKGNYWTINLSSIPHELLLRQNTLVSRYAQDSGFRYRKDLSEVFDLSTGEIKIKIPIHLLNQNAIRNHRSPLVDDPAAVMEAILLEETGDEDRSSNQSNAMNDKMVFTLQDLFSQDENCDEESRSRRNARSQKSPNTNMTMVNPTVASYMNQTKSPYANSPLQMKDSAANPINVPMATGFDRQLLAFQMLQNAMSNNMIMNAAQQQQQPHNNAAALMAAQNAFLSKALTSKISTSPVLQNMIYAANQMNNMRGILPPNFNSKSNGSDTGADEQRNSSTPNSDKSLSSEEPTKRKKQRKGLPLRRSSVDENDNELSNVPVTSKSISPTPRSASWEAEKQRLTGNGAPFGMTTSSSLEGSFDGEEGANGIGSAPHSFQNIPMFSSTIHAGKMA